MKHQILAGVSIIAAGTLIALGIIFLKPDVKREPPKSIALLVEVMEAEPTSTRIKITAYGTVEPEEEIILFPEVSGTIVSDVPDFKIGKILEKGQPLIKIDPSNYLIAVEQEKANLVKAEFELKLEEGRQVIAKREWELLSTTVKETEIGEELALRVPHLQEKQAAVKAAESRLAQAILNLQRTEIKSPFKSIVLEDNADLGQYVSPQTQIGKLAAVDAFRVKVSIPYSSLHWVEVPGAEARIIQVIGSQRTLEKSGTVTRLLGDVDPLGRLVRLVVQIDDPLGLEGGDAPKNPLLLGAYVRVEILGPEVQNVFRVPRTALKEDSSLLLKDEENLLEIRPVNILFRDADYVFIDKGLESGEEIVLTPLPLVIPGTELRTADEENQ
ncbi:MAG: efflux RND transporter periplasmic adaptor subunit [Chlamydiia bacterium]|nr:efflux RND transporter periplasmic adaptor subunit [Chlamydiia bacterium]